VKKGRVGKQTTIIKMILVLLVFGVGLNYESLFMVQKVHGKSL